MPKRKTPEEKPEEQFERFKETVRNLKIDATGKDFEKAFKAVVPAVNRSKDNSKPDQSERGPEGSTAARRPKASQGR